MRKVFVNSLVLLLSLLYLNAQDTIPLHIIPISAQYNESSTRFTLGLAFENTGQDTLVFLRPEAAFFEEHYSSPAISFIGETEKPYRYLIKEEGDCTTFSERPPLPQPVGLDAQLKTYHFVTLPPGERSRNFYVHLHTGHREFCSNVNYTVQVSYSPHFEYLPKKHIRALREKAEAFESLIAETNQFLLQQNLSADTIDQRMSPMHLILDANPFIKALSRIEASSPIVQMEKR